MMKTEDRHSVWFRSSCNGMADNASLFVEYFGWIGFYVWEDVPAGGLLTGLYLFRSWSNSISGGGFIWFSNTLGLYSACLPFCFF